MDIYGNTYAGYPPIECRVLKYHSKGPHILTSCSPKMGDEKDVGTMAPGLAVIEKTAFETPVSFLRVNFKFFW